MPEAPVGAYEIADAVWGDDMSLVDHRFATARALSHLHYMAIRRPVEWVSSDGTTHWKRR
ncbi:MAG: hypothetical protein OXN97_01605 [Bryobacterales bacterium]|nr:hypothetical protein [Bryobacterales bacterium]